MGRCVLGEMLQDVPALVDLTPLPHGRPAERLSHRRVEGLRPIDDHQQASVSTESATREIGQQSLQTVACSVAPSQRPSGCLAPVVSRPNATTMQCSPMCTPSMSSTARSRSIARRRPPRVQLCLRGGHKPPTDRTLARAPRRDLHAERVATPRILAGRDTDEHLVDHPPVQWIRVRKRPRRGQRHFRAVAAGARTLDRDLPPAQHDLTGGMPRAIRLPRRLMRIPGPTHRGPILFEHRLEHLQARGHNQLLELGLGVKKDVDQRQVARSRGCRLAVTRDCARLLLHGGSFLGTSAPGFPTSRLTRPEGSRRFKFQQSLGHPPVKLPTGESS